MMPKLDEETQHARRVNILDAAERCFVRSGFRGASVHDICREAGVSPGALYLYFASKEDLIAGLCQREAEDFGTRFAGLAEAPDFIAALNEFAQHCVNHPRDKVLLHLEIGAEAGRNLKVGEIALAADRFLMSRFEELLERVKAQGRIAPIAGCATVTRILAAMGDGLFWHRARDPDFKAEAVLPAMMAMISTLINPTSTPPPSRGIGQESKDLP
jgi:AcrR family transcriptional regulator